MKNILFYGNCQLEKIKDILNLSPSEYNVCYICCFNTSLSDIEFDTVIKISDIIITQPIHDSYRDMYYLSSNYVVNNCKQNSTIIFVNNCHFSFYFFDLNYDNSGEYYHEYIVDCINNNKNFYYYQKLYIENEQLKTFDELNDNYDNNIDELQKRYNNMLEYTKNNTFFINIIPFINNNYRNKLLFYTINKPTKYLLQYIALEILKITNIKNTIDYDLDPFSYEKYILYSCIEKVVNFKIKEHNDIVNIEQIFNSTYNKFKFNL
jgi:hypothetical protein